MATNPLTVLGTTQAPHASLMSGVGRVKVGARASWSARSRDVSGVVA
jgi:hypothetical protein